MKESGWLTKSLEQPHPYNLDFPGKINSKKVKSSFLSLLDSIEKNELNPLIALTYLFSKSILKKTKN